MMPGNASELLIIRQRDAIGSEPIVAMSRALTMPGPETPMNTLRSTGHHARGHDRSRAYLEW
jgi:hypothetical protein